MGKYIHKFNSWEEFDEAYEGDDYVEPWLSCVEGESDSVTYNYKKLIIVDHPPIIFQ